MQSRRQTRDYPPVLDYRQRTMHKYRRRQSVFFGSILIPAGLLSIGFYVAAVVVGLKQVYGADGSAIWIGFVYIVTGSLGIGVGFHNKRCAINGMLTMSIISTFLATIELLIASLGAVESNLGFTKCDNEFTEFAVTCDDLSVIHGMAVALAVLAAVALLSSFWLSVICCSAVCGCCHSDPPVTITSIPTAPPPTVSGHPGPPPSLYPHLGYDQHGYQGGSVNMQHEMAPPATAPGYYPALHQYPQYDHRYMSPPAYQ